MKPNYHIDLRLSEDLLRKLLYVSEAEHRSPAAQFAFMLRNNVAYFEKTKGKIPEKALKELDLSAYREETE